MSITAKIQKCAAGKLLLGDFMEQFRIYAEDSKLIKVPFMDKERIRIKYHGDICCPITFLYYCKRFKYLEPEKYLSAAWDLGLNLRDALRITTATDHPFTLGMWVSVESIAYIRSFFLEVLKIRG